MQVFPQAVSWLEYPCLMWMVVAVSECPVWQGRVYCPDGTNFGQCVHISSVSCHCLVPWQVA